jgi:hypothetical protein
MPTASFVFNICNNGHLVGLILKVVCGSFLWNWHVRKEELLKEFLVNGQLFVNVHSDNWGGFYIKVDLKKQVVGMEQADGTNS